VVVLKRGDVYVLHSDTDISTHAREYVKGGTGEENMHNCYIFIIHVKPHLSIHGR